MQKKGLGRGLDALLAGASAASSSPETAEHDAASQHTKNPPSPASAAAPAPEGMMEVDIASIDPNPRQPRKDFNTERLQELSTSISHSGIIQPLLVQKHGERYTIIAGERRWRAARLAGLQTVPILVRHYNEEEMMELALVENLQRDDLNPLEEASGIQLLIQEHDLTQEEVATRLGKSRTAITNSLRLLKLPESIRQMLRQGLLSSGHGRALLSLSSAALQEAVAQEVTKKHLSVRQTEALVKARQQDKPPRSAPALSPELNDVELRLQSSLATKVKIQGNLRRGSIRIEYYSEEQLDQLYEILNQPE